MSEENQNKVQLLDVIRAEVQSLITTSMSLREKIEKAGTSVKKEYYKKKLQKNNVRLMEMLQYADRLDNIKKQQGEAADEADSATE